MSHLQSDFEIFDNANPMVYRLFKKFAWQVKLKGHNHYSARSIIHRLRWHVLFETESDDGFKINDHWSPYYARKLMAEYPGTFGTFFELRGLKA